MLCSTLVTLCALNITLYQRTFLGTSANQKRHYLKSYNKTYFFCFNSNVSNVYNNDVVIYKNKNSHGNSSVCERLYFIFLFQQWSNY